MHQKEMRLGNEQKMDENSLTAASESARTALKLCDEIIDAAMNTDQAEATRRSLRSLSGRSLRLVADCYACAGSAVTAEGLYQSSLASLELGNPLSSIERRLVYKSYSSLCSKWDKRTGDADKMEAKSGEVEGAHVEGPFAFDNAVSPDAAKLKGIDNAVAGNAEVSWPWYSRKTSAARRRRCRSCGTPGSCR